MSMEIDLPATDISLRDLLRTLTKYGIDSDTKGGNVLLTYQGRLVSGYIRDAESGEVLIGAVIYTSDFSLGTATNQSGYYALKVPKSQIELTVKYVGYQATRIDLIPDSQTQDIGLQPENKQLKSLTVSSLASDVNVKNIIPSSHRLYYDKKGDIPYFLGEVDVLQEAIMLPGIRTLGEDASGLNVRGGGVDQNLILLDEAMIFNPNHFFGLISVFNPEAVRQVTLMKGYIPPNLGGRASSVIHVQQREGSYEAFKGAGGIGLISGRLILEGPLIKDKASFLVSGRQSILGLTTDRLERNALQRTTSSFQDFNFKVNYQQNDKNTYYLSGYIGNDRNKNILDQSRRWGNNTLTFRWNHAWKADVFSNTSISYSDYNYRIIDPVEAASFVGRSNISNISIKHDINWFKSDRSQFDFGFQYLFHVLEPGERLPIEDGNSSTNPLTLDNEHGIEFAGYFSHQLALRKNVFVNYGLRYTGLATLGPAAVVTYQDLPTSTTSEPIDTIQYTGRSLVDFFNGIEPRVSLNWLIKKNQSMKLSYTRSNQYLQLYSATAIPSPTDIWKLANRFAPPIQSDHLSLGYYINFLENQWTSNLEVYVKSLDNLIDYRDGADLLFNPTPETELILTEGRAYGTEFFLAKNSGSWTGWFSYTLSRSERRVKDTRVSPVLNDGTYYPDNQDKTHDLNVLTKFQPNSKWNFSASFFFQTGRPITLPDGRYQINGQIVPYFSNRNQDRLSNYHRLDLATKWTPKAQISKRWKGAWTATIYNVYARKNAYTYLFRPSENDPLTTEVVKYSIFGSAIPSISYSFEF